MARALRVQFEGARDWGKCSGAAVAQRIRRARLENDDKSKARLRQQILNIEI
jgi:hypothetical protein